MKFVFKKGLGVYIVFLFVLISSIGYSQVPGVVWSKYLTPTTGFSRNGIFVYSSIRTSNGFVVTGIDTSYSYSKRDILNKYSSGRAWISKLDNSGNLIWNANGNVFDPHRSGFLSLCMPTPGLYVAAGYGDGLFSTSSKSDFLIAGYNDAGSRIWEEIYGGYDIDRAYSIQSLHDKGYIMAGFTISNDTVVIGNHSPGIADVWVVKVDSSRSLKWKKCYGGSGEDSAYAILETPDNGFIVAGVSTSSNGDLTGNNGLSDGWIFKIDVNGNIIWQKNIGGAGHDAFKSIVANSDGSYTLTGYTTSSSVLQNGHKGQTDLWVVTINGSDGSIIWSKGYGGTADEQGYSIERTVGNGYLIAGYTESGDGDVTGHSGRADAWLLNLDNSGTILWQKAMGTSKDEFGMTVSSSPFSGLIVGGFANPIVPDPQSYFDSTDGFIVKLGNFNTIKGLLFLDNNSNGIKDPGEMPFSEATVRTEKSGNIVESISSNGIFRLDVDTGNYNTSVVLQNSYFTVVPASHTSNFTNYLNTDSFSFALQPLPGRPDLKINIVPMGPARPGFYVWYQIIYKNVGTEPISAGEVLFVKDPKLVYYFFEPDYTSYSGDTIKWSYTNLQPQDSASISIILRVLTPPIVNNGNILSSVAIITPVNGDLTPQDDTAYLKQVVTGSYDPNDKNENNAGTITQAYVNSGKYLNYLIRFQNTGTDTAFNVIIRDTLDNKLNWSTLEMVAASHPYLVNITDQNKIAWTFPDIHLPDSNINEPASHGYIAYRIKPNLGLSPGDVVSNSASIYFDFNLPVVTNTVLTEVAGNQALPLTLLDFKAAYKNDITELYWSTTNEYDVQKFEIERSFNGTNYSIIGVKKALNANSGITDYTFTDDLRNTANQSLFYYRLKMVDIDGKTVYSNVILVRRDQQLLRQIQILPNPVSSTSAQVLIPSSANVKGIIRVMDLSGHVLLEQTERLYPGTNSVLIRDLSKLSGGTYILQVIWDGHSNTKKFIIQ